MCIRDSTDPAPAGEEIPVVTKQDGYYYVTYQIAVTDPVENMNRYGRLNCEEFSVTDTLSLIHIFTRRENKPSHPLSMRGRSGVKIMRAGLCSAERASGGLRKGC